MTQTKSGAKKAVKTVKERHGEHHYALIGSIGGKTPTSKPKGFAAASPEERSKWGKKGGSRKKKKRT